jgi:hypothetical protein
MQQLQNTSSRRGGTRTNLYDPFRPLRRLVGGLGSTRYWATTWLYLRLRINGFRLLTLLARQSQPHRPAPPGLDDAALPRRAQARLTRLRKFSKAPQPGEEAPMTRRQSQHQLSRPEHHQQAVGNVSPGTDASKAKTSAGSISMGAGVRQWTAAVSRGLLYFALTTARAKACLPEFL